MFLNHCAINRSIIASDKKTSEKAMEELQNEAIKRAKAVFPEIKSVEAARPLLTEDEFREMSVWGERYLKTGKPLIFFIRIDEKLPHGKWLCGKSFGVY